MKTCLSPGGEEGFKCPEGLTVRGAASRPAASGIQQLHLIPGTVYLILVIFS